MKAIKQKTLKLFKPHSGQLQIIKAFEKYKYIVINAGRRFGKTEMCINIMLKECLTKQMTCLFLSYSQDQRQQVFNDFINTFGQFNFILKKNGTDYKIYFKNGSEISFKLASWPAVESIRGKKFNLIICDEFALYKKDVFETIIQPTLATYKDYKVIFISTPRGKGEFYKIFNFGKTKENWISFQFPSSVNPLVNKEFLDSVKEEITERIFRQEYLAEFIEDGGEVFGNIKDCTKDLYYFNNVKSTRFWAGLDVGLKNDKTVLTVVDENYNVVDINQIKAKNLTEIATKVIDILKNYKDCKLYVETNFGSGLTEILKEKGLRNVYDFVTTTQSKKEMIEHLQMLFETKKISLPNYNNFLLDELINFTYKYNTSTRNITYSAPDGLHDDYVMSLAIACINRLKNNYNLEISFIHK